METYRTYIEAYGNIQKNKEMETYRAIWDHIERNKHVWKYMEIYRTIWNYIDKY